MLQVKDLDVYYGAIQALHHVSIDVAEGEIVSIIGSNGAGKSTLMRTISGLIKPRQGSIQFQGESLLEKQADQIVRLGVSQSPEGRRIFTNMTVQENLLIGATIRKDSEVASDLDGVLDRFPRLRERFKQNAGTLSGGEQQMLAIGRALMSRPKLLLLDEPSMGLAPIVVQRIFEVVRRVNAEGVTVLLVEQNARAALALAGRGYVMESGAISLSGAARELLDNPQVRAAYLGEAA